MDLNFY